MSDNIDYTKIVLSELEGICRLLALEYYYFCKIWKKNEHVSMNQIKIVGPNCIFPLLGIHLKFTQFVNPFKMRNFSVGSTISESY